MPMSRPATSSSPDDLSSLQSKWTALYRSTLPHLALTQHTKSTVPQDSSPPHQPYLHTPWPVTLDHCFARIILDNVVGLPEGKPWTEVLKKPAVKNMTEGQLRGCLELGQAVERGEVDLSELDGVSLGLRGKKGKGKGGGGGGGMKRKRGEGEELERAEKAVKSEIMEVKMKSEEGNEDDTVESELKKEDRDSQPKADAEYAEDTGHAAQASPADSAVDVAHTPQTDSSKEQHQHHHSTSSHSSAEAPLPTKKTRKAEMVSIWSSFHPSKPTNSTSPNTTHPSPSSNLTPEETAALDRAKTAIRNDTSMSAYRRHVLLLLTQVPKGKWTTYQILADAAVRLQHTPISAPSNPSNLSNPSTNMEKNHSKTARGNARAVGSAMRNNPFAPTVPCHRVLATGGKLGGFGGDWGDEGRFAAEKRRLLREEGVGFDGKGRVVGLPWNGFGGY